MNVLLIFSIKSFFFFFFLILCGLCRCLFVCEVWIHWAGFLNTDTFACQAGLHVAEVFLHEKKSLKHAASGQNNVHKTSIVNNAHSLLISTQKRSGAGPTYNQSQLLARLSADVQQQCSPWHCSFPFYFFIF